MKRSIGEADQASRSDGSNDDGNSGAACRAGGVNAQWLLSDVASRSSMVAAGAGCVESLSLPGPLQSAPAVTQLSSVAISSAESFSSGGIASSSTCRTAATSLLLAASPGTTTGPVSLPARSARLLSSRRPASATLSPWQPWHLATKSGRTRDSKRVSSSRDVASAAVATPLPRMPPSTRARTEQRRCGMAKLFMVHCRRRISPAGERSQRPEAGSTLSRPYSIRLEGRVHTTVPGRLASSGSGDRRVKTAQQAAFSPVRQSAGRMARASRLEPPPFRRHEDADDPAVGASF